MSRPSSSSGSAGLDEAVLGPVEPGGRGDAGEDREDDRQRGGDRQDAAVPAGDEEGEQQVEEDVDDREDLAALEALPAADRDHGGDSGGDQQQEDDERLGALRLGLLPVRPPELVSRTDGSRFHSAGKSMFSQGTRATPKPWDAGGGTRTPKLFRARAPKAGVSSSFTTPAGRLILRTLRSSARNEDEPRGGGSSERRGTQDSNLESPALEAGALASLASAPRGANRSLASVAGLPAGPAARLCSAGRFFTFGSGLGSGPVSKRHEGAGAACRTRPGG